MSRHLSRIAPHGVSMVASAVFALPLIAAFLHPDLTWGFPFLLVALLTVSAARPLSGLLLTMVVLPFCVLLEQRVSGMPAGAEITDALLLAFVSGASLRTRWPGPGFGSRLAGPALVFLAVIVSSTIAELRALQAITPREPILGDVWRHVVHDYWMAPRELPVVHHAFRWMAWVVAAVYTERLLRLTPAWHGLAFRLWLSAGVAGALLSAVRLLEIVLRADGSSGVVLFSVMRDLRLTVLQPDLNAAGSYFALFLVPALFVGAARRVWWVLGGAVPLMTLAFVLARSRAAIAAVVLVLCGAYSLRLMGHRRSRADEPEARRAWRIAGIGLLGAVALVMMFYATTQSHIAPSAAMQIRAEMTRVALTASQRYPVFGVGLGDYIRMTRRFITPDMPLLHGFAPNGENAHNNFLQIVVELGIPAGVVFLWLVLPVAAMGFVTVRRDDAVGIDRQGLALGVAAFLVSALFGHPFLIPQVGAAFFLAVGLAAGLARPAHNPGWATKIAGGAVVFYLGSLIWR